jgi:hypothetical protein
MTQIFISYSHKDEAMKDRVIKHLAVLLSAGVELEIWNDRRIMAGDDWRQQIRDAIEECDVALLLVSADFLTSNFIIDEEIPRLLERRKASHVRVIPVILGHCSWKSVGWLSQLQARPLDAKPLSTSSKANVDKELSRLADEIHQLSVEKAAAVSVENGGSAKTKVQERVATPAIARLSEQGAFAQLPKQEAVENVTHEARPHDTVGEATPDATVAEALPSLWVQDLESSKPWLQATEIDREWLHTVLQLVRRKFPAASLYPERRNGSPEALVIGTTAESGRRLVLRFGVDSRLGQAGRVHLRVGVNRWKYMHENDAAARWIDRDQASSSAAVETWIDGLPKEVLLGLR